MLQAQGQTVNAVNALTGILAVVRQVDFRRSELTAPLALQRLKVDRIQIKVIANDVGQLVFDRHRIQHVRSQQHIGLQRLQINAEVLQHMSLRLEVVA